MTVLEDATPRSGDIAELGHAIHREPEIGLHLPKTQAKVLAALDTSAGIIIWRAQPRPGAGQCARPAPRRPTRRV